MASPLDNLRNSNPILKGQGGGLQQTSAEELQNLTRRAERPIGPSTPVEAGVLGASPDQAKMVGTPAQSFSAQRQAIRNTSDQATAQRQEQARKAATSEEQAAQERQKSLQGLGDIKSRVQQIADKMLTGQGAQTARALSVDNDRLKAAVADPNNLPRASELSAKVGNNTATPQDMVELGQLLGYTDVSDVQALESQVKADLMTAESETGKFAASSIADTVKVGDMTPEQVQSLGFTDLSQAAALLNTTPEALSGMSIKELQESVTQAQNEGYAQVHKMQAVLASPAASRAEKEQALRLLKEKGAVGIGASEQDFSKMVEGVQAGDSVSFGGQEYKLDELLKDDTISGMVKNYFLDDSIAKNLKETEPEFANWIEQNRSVLQQVAADVSESAAAFSKIQTDNLALKNTEVGTLSDDTAKTIIGEDFGKIRGERYTPPPALEYINDNSKPQAQRAGLLDSLNKTSSINKDVAKDLAQADESKLQATGLTKDGGFQSYTAYVQDVDNISKAYPENVYQAFGLSEGGLQKALTQTRARNSSGLVGDSTNAISALFDADGDGLPDNPADVKARALDWATGGRGRTITVSDLASQGTTVDKLNSTDNALRNMQSALATHTNDLFEKVGHYWEDGQFDAHDANDLRNRKDISFYDAYDVASKARGFTPNGKETLNSVLGSKADEQVDKDVKALGFTSSDLDNLINLAQQDVGRIGKANIARLDKFVDDLTLQVKQYSNGMLKERAQALLNKAENLQKRGVTTRPREKMEQKYGKDFGTDFYNGAKDMRSNIIHQGTEGSVRYATGGQMGAPNQAENAIQAGASAPTDVQERVSKKVFKRAKGGIVPKGYPNDNYPAELTTGEIIVPADKAKKLFKQADVDPHELSDKEIDEFLDALTVEDHKPRRRIVREEPINLGSSSVLETLKKRRKH